MYQQIVANINWYEKKGRNSKELSQTVPEMVNVSYSLVHEKMVFGGLFCQYLYHTSDVVGLNVLAGYLK